jgi:hypothetical protein
MRVNRDIELHKGFLDTFAQTFRFWSRLRYMCHTIAARRNSHGTSLAVAGLWGDQVLGQVGVTGC